MKKSIAIILTTVIIITSLIGCIQEAPVTPQTEELNKYKATFFELFNTVTVVVGYDNDEESFNKKVEFIKAEMKTYHELYDIYNDYDGTNNIKTINDNAGKAAVKVDEKIIDLMEFGKQVYKETNGLTNMAMGSVLQIWHDYREVALDDPGKAALPSMEELEKAAEHMNIDDVVIDREAGTVFLKDPEMSLDVGSLGKGYAVERICLNMEAQGINYFLLSAGGNVRCIGRKPDGKFWETGVENPYGEAEFMGILEMEDEALVISGNYQRFYVYDGKRYHHIINPNTLMPEDNMAAVAVLCNDSGVADAASTALFNMTPEEGKIWCEARGDMEAMWMLNDRTAVYSSGFEKNLKQGA